MKKQAKEIKKGDFVLIVGKKFKVIDKEISDMGKHGKSKVRLELLTTENEKLVIIRPEDYPIDVI